MVELTYGGAWFKWDSLDRRGRKLAAISIGTSVLAALPMGIVVYDWAFGVGFRAGSGGGEPPVTGVSAFIATGGLRWLVAASLILTVVSALAWWRFSINQDEMFNRIQNYAIGQATAWTFAVVFVSWLLELGGWAAPLPLAALVAVGLFLLLGFWLHAVRRWA